MPHFVEEFACNVPQIGEVSAAMKLIDWMRREKVDDAAMAERIGDCTEHAVKKWKYGERSPDPNRIARIEHVTGGEVSFPDWVTLAPSSAPDPEPAEARS